jgi:hypothetical protein
MGSPIQRWPPFCDGSDEGVISMAETRSQSVQEAHARAVNTPENDKKKPPQGERTAKTAGTDRSPDPSAGGDIRSDQRLKGGSTGSSG